MPLQGVSSNQAPRRSYLSDIRAGGVVSHLLQRTRSRRHDYGQLTTWPEPSRRKGEWLYDDHPYQTIPWALVGTLAVGEEPAGAGCAFSTLIRAVTLAAMFRNAAARGEAGSLITIGSPRSPPILSSVSTGMLPRRVFQD